MTGLFARIPEPSGLRRLFGVCFSGALFFSALSGPALAAADSWGVLAPGIPKRVSTADEASNVSFYILKQTHEPVLRIQDGTAYSSKILKSWSRSLDYRDFKFCLAPHLEFAPGIPFSSDDFSALVSSFTSGYSRNASVSRQGDCVEVSFDVPKEDYLYFWTLYAHAPTKDSGEKAELGLGPFRVIGFSGDLIKLVRKNAVSDGYNSIEIHGYNGEGNPNLLSRKIKDFNLISTAAVPEWVKGSFQSFDNPEMKSLVLVINHPDPKIRARVYNCVDIRSLRSAFFPGKTEFYDIATVLPMGVPGALPGLPVQDCPASGKLSGELRFANWKNGNLDEMRKFAADFKDRSGISLRLDQYTMDEFTREFNRSVKPFDLAIIMNYVDPSPKIFFEMYFSEGKIYDFDIRAISKEYRKVLEGRDSGSVASIFRKLSYEISDHALALPVSQSKRTLYYPREIKNLNVGQGIVEYPEIAEFRR